MNILCPHCSQQLEITPEMLSSLQDQPHFACPSCQGLIAAPEAAPRRTQASSKSKSAVQQAQRGMNRNMLVLGIAALVVLGGIGIFLASRGGGNIFNMLQNTTNQIIHNNYFTQLIASGVTTEKDLKAIAEIRPYGDGFIGISKEALSWEEADSLAKRTGSEILPIEDSAEGSRQQLIDWLKTTFTSQFGSTLWVKHDGQTKVTDGHDVLGVTTLDTAKKAILQWKPNAGRTTTDPALATKVQPFINSLGMKFVPVPGTKVLFCIHHTRKGDYRKYAAAAGGVDDSWKNLVIQGVPVSENDDHPVVRVTWHDANAFCAWLSKIEGRSYRLPKDHEWSVAVGIGALEDENASPASKNMKIKDVYPWGSVWPPPEAAGNIGDSTYKQKFPQSSQKTIEGYRDGYATTSPVMSFTPNKLGIYDLSGNVWQWCEDWYEIEHNSRVGRGGAWDHFDRDILLSSRRGARPPVYRSIFVGFRVVLELAKP